MRRFAFAIIVTTMIVTLPACSSNVYCDNFGYPIDKIQFCPEK